MNACDYPPVQFPGMTDAIIGWATPTTTTHRAVIYSKRRLKNILMACHAMTEDEATAYIKREFCEKYHGDAAPIIMED